MKTKGKLRKILRRIALVIFIALVTLSLAAGLLTYIFEDDIKTMAIREVNDNLQSKVVIKGSDIHLTFFTTFPNVAIRFENFKIMEPGSVSAVLAEVKTLDFEFSPLDFINKQYHISRIVLRDATIHLKIFENGTNNFDILKPDTAKKPIGPNVPLDIKLRSIKLKNVNLSYEDLQDNRHLKIKINNSVFSGSFTDALYELKMSADMNAEDLTLGKQQFLKNKNIKIEAGLEINNLKHSYTIQNFKLKIDKSIFDAKGSVTKHDKTFATNLSIDGEDAGIQTLISLLPGSISSN